MANTNYGYQTSPGVAGGIYDISPKTVVSRILDSAAGIHFGQAVVKGTTEGVSVKAPTAGTTAADVEGVVTHTFTQPMDENGKVKFVENQTVGVMQKGKVWVRASSNATTVAYGAPVYLVIEDAATPENVGAYTDTADTTSTKVQLTNAKFLTAVQDGIAVIELS